MLSDLEVSRQNMAMMERAMSLFTPFYRPTDPTAAVAPDPRADEIASLKAELERLRTELAKVKAKD